MYVDVDRRLRNDVSALPNHQRLCTTKWRHSFQRSDNGCQANKAINEAYSHVLKDEEILQNPKPKYQLWKFRKLAQQRHNYVTNNFISAEWQ